MFFFQVEITTNVLIVSYFRFIQLNTTPANTKHLHNIITLLGQRRRRWSDIVQMLFIFFVFAGNVMGHWVYIRPL